MNVINTTATSIAVQWGMVPCIHQNGDITGYSVRYEINGTVNSEQILSVSTTTVTIPDLNSSTTYSIAVAAIVNSLLIGEYSDPGLEITNGMTIHVCIIM